MFRGKTLALVKFMSFGCYFLLGLNCTILVSIILVADLNDVNRFFCSTY